MKADGVVRAPDCAGRRFAIVVARFYQEVAERLVEGAQHALRECGVARDLVEVHDVAGCFELPLGCRYLIDTGRYDGLVALGCVIRGETPHFDLVAGECARGIMDVQLATRTPIGFGVLTTDNVVQADARAGAGPANKGHAAALAAASMLCMHPAPPRPARSLP